MLLSLDFTLPKTKLTNKLMTKPLNIAKKKCEQPAKAFVKQKKKFRSFVFLKQSIDLKWIKLCMLFMAPDLRFSDHSNFTNIE